MKKFIALVLITFMSIHPVLGDPGNDPFYDSGEKSGLWRVLGLFPSKKFGHGYGCVAMTRWDDGSTLALIHDIETHEIGLEIEYNSLDFEGDDGDEFSGQFIFEKKNGAKKVLSMQYIRNSSHSLTIRYLNPEVFIMPFVSYDNLNIQVSDGTYFQVNLNGTNEAIGHMSKCWDESKKYRSSQDM